MRLSLLIAAGILTRPIFGAVEEAFVLTQSPDQDYNAQGQWIHLSKRHGDPCQKYHTGMPFKLRVLNPAQRP
jgi:hypothetical protein